MLLFQLIEITLHLQYRWLILLFLVQALHVRIQILFLASIDKIKSRKTSDREHQVDWVRFAGCIVIALEVDHGR